MSPFFLTRCAKKCLEHLIRHYQVHIFNVADIMRCILPFHHTKDFARVIKILRFTGTAPATSCPSPMPAPHPYSRLVFAYSTTDSPLAADTLP